MSANVLAIIPARGGSKTIPRKNLALCAGKPLIQWTFDAVADSSVNWVVLTSDDDEILGLVPPGVIPHKRPLELATDEASTEGVIEDVLARWPTGTVVLLQPTSPIRTGQQINEAVELLQQGRYDSVLSVSPSHVFTWRETKHGTVCNYDIRKRPRRQEIHQWQENGSIYVFTRAHWEKHHNRLGGKIRLYKMGEDEAIQVDTPLDLFIVEQILLRRQREALTA